MTYYETATEGHTAVRKIDYIYYCSMCAICVCRIYCQTYRLGLFIAAPVLVILLHTRLQ